MKSLFARQSKCLVYIQSVVAFFATTVLTTAFFATAVLLVACQEQEETSSEVSNADHQGSTSSMIPLSEALGELNTVLVGLEDKSAITGTRSIVSTRAVKSVQFVGEATDPLVYIVNFEQNQGYAILAADRRVQDPVIAVIDEGSLSEADFNQMEDESPSAMLVSLIKKCLKRSAQATTSREIEETWQTTKKIDPMLVTLWGQAAPFNTFCPRKRWSIFQSYKVAPAGCVPVAIAQIMTFHEFPKNLVCKRISIDWKSLQKMSLYVENDSLKYIAPDNTQKSMAAALLYQIGVNCHSIYTRDWTFTLPTGAKECFKRMSYFNVQLYNGYAENKILEMLDNHCPVFVSATSGLRGGHAWVIDGMMMQTRQTNGLAQHRILMHCNFGWSGLANGFYASKLFYTTDGSLVRNGYESGFGSKSIYDYNCFFNTITYIKPSI